MHIYLTLSMAVPNWEMETHLSFLKVQPLCQWPQHSKCLILSLPFLLPVSLHMLKAYFRTED